MTRAWRRGGLSGFLVALSALLADPPVGAQDDALRYFPLEEGHWWRWGGTFRYAESEVIRRRGDVVVLRYQLVLAADGHLDWGPIYYWLVERGNEIDIDLPAEGLQPHYRFGEESFTHSDLTDNWKTVCMDGVEVTVVSRTERVETPAGTFEPCTELRYGELGCEYGMLEEWWHPGVGLVRWRYNHTTGPYDWYLLDFWVGPRFVRGDAQSDGIVGIADPIALLGYLFLGSQEPSCLDAADADDSGTLELSDAVYLLGWLFSGGSLPAYPAPPAAGAYQPGDCGPDPTPSDPLQCAALSGVCG
jgi:hypothetical protein